jgi:hypothetical protein
MGTAAPHLPTSSGRPAKVAMMRSAFFIGRALAWPKGLRGTSPRASGGASGLYHHVVVLDRDRHGLGDVGAGDEPRSRLH